MLKNLFTEIPLPQRDIRLCLNLYLLEKTQVLYIKQLKLIDSFKK